MQSHLRTGDPSHRFYGMDFSKLLSKKVLGSTSLGTRVEYLKLNWRVTSCRGHFGGSGSRSRTEQLADAL